MVEIASFVLDVVKCLAAPIGRPFKYLYNYKKNIDNLQGEVTKLKNTRDELQVKVTAAERNSEQIKQSVKDWQKDVEKTITEAEKLIQEKENDPRCFKGLCPNWITRYKHSKKAFKLKQDDISQLLDKNILPFLPQEDKVAHPTTPQDIWLRSAKDYVALESRTSTEKNVRDALNDENIYMIGVYGMGGIGKTTLVQDVGRKAMEEGLFDEMVFIEVTKTPNTETIQEKIAEKLGLELKKESGVADKANKLYARLKMSKKDKKDEKGEKDKEDKKDEKPTKILLILDNIWEAPDLTTVGIPSGDDRGGCKLLLTTRDLDVLDRMDSINNFRMGSTNNFRMGTLNEEEALRLFRMMAGNVIQTPELNSLPNDVCKECGGLPIVICTIAKALKNKTQKSQWEDALRVLRKPVPAKFARVLEKEYSKIKLSYDYLEHDELKKTFIISSLMENDTSISDLFKNIVGLGILEGANLTIEEARNRLDVVVKGLKDSCLLLDGSTKGRFSMHDIVRVVALTCGYTDHHVFTEKNDIDSEWKEKDKLRKCTIISLVGNNIITQLWPEGLDCPELEFFDMRSRGSSFEIPEEFFRVMPKLKVLNLFEIQQSLLPQSLDLLTNLQTLCLDGSKIENVAIIGKLKKLKVLSLRYANIKELPTEIGQLNQLRLLDLSNCWGLIDIAPNVISKLSQLEELYIKRCHIQWKVEVLEELKGLFQLTGLEIDIEDNKMLPKDFFSKELKRYKISIGDEWWYSINLPNYEPSRVLEFKYDSTISLEELRIVKNVELLRLFEVSDDDNNLTPLFNEKVIFSNLMGLEMTNICSRKIWDNQLPTSMSSSYKNLTRLTLWRCRNIKYAFPSIIAKSLIQLQQLAIRYCEALEEIVAKEEGANAVVNFVFPNVISLQLLNLPALTVFYPEIHTSKWPMLKKFVVIDCDKFTSKHMSFQENSEKGELHISESKSIFLDDKINSNLEKMLIENENIVIEWQGQSKALTIKNDQSRDIPFELLQRFENMRELSLRGNEYKELLFPNPLNLERLRVDSCNGLMKLITPSTARSLVQLREMMVNDCKALEEIIAKEEGANAVVDFVFPNVTSLQLRYLPALTVFYPEIHTSEWPMLKELEVIDCDKFTLKHMSFQENSEEGELHISEPKSTFLDDKINSDLEKLRLENNLTDITWNSQSKSLEIANDKSTKLGLLQRFQNLKKLKLHGNDRCKEIKCLLDLSNLEVLKVIVYMKLMTLVPSSASFQNLKVLKVSNCYGLMMKLMTPSMVRSLVQLREMSIEDCIMIVEIVENEGDATTSTEIVFNNLKKLLLEKLENLTCFCSGNYSFNFPSLEELIIRECPNMKTFSQGILNTPKLQKIDYDEEEKDLENGGSDLNSTIQQAHKVQVDSNLKELSLTLSGRDIMSIWEGEFQESFGEVKTLELIKDEYANIPIQILHKFNSLQNLILRMGLYEEIFSFEEDEEHIGALKKLKELYLCGLFNLKCISKQDSRLNSNLQNLDTLQVVHCHNLTTLLPSLASFENLRTLSLVYCNGMQNVMSSSTAQSLVRLEELFIGYCDMMIEVLANEGDIEKGEIVFEKLKELSLENLESLTYFYSGKYTLKFPLLKELNLRECSKMKTFFGGGLSMPKLQKLNNKDCSESDIDTIIQQLQNDCSELWKRFPDYDD